MGGDGKIDGKIIIQRNQGISQAIRDELNLTQEQCNSLGKSVWTKIFEQVDEQQKKGDIYEGSNDAFSDSPPNYVVHENQKIEFSADIWENIVKLVNDKLGTTIKTGDTYEVQKGGGNGAPTNRGGKVKAEDIKVKVPQAHMNGYIKGIIQDHKKGAALKENLRKGDTRGVDKYTVATAFDSSINFGPNSRKQAKVVFEALVTAMDLYNVQPQKNDYKDWATFSKLPIKKQNQILHSYRNQVLAAENEKIREADREKAYHNKNIGKIQKTFDDANDFLVEVANMKKKPKIQKGHSEKDNYNWKSATLPDGRWIEVEYDDKGEINNIKISHDTTPDHESDGSTYDGVDVKYYKDIAWYDIDKSNGNWEGSIRSGYDFEKLKAVAEKIFGKWNE